MPTKAHPEPLRGSLSSDAAVAARQWEVLQFLWAKHPEWRTQALASFRRKLRREELNKGQLTEARRQLRRMLARRGLTVSAGEEARIDLCTSVARLDRWIDQAVVASSTAEALGLRRRPSDESARPVDRRPEA
jgi:hypothetical protein